MKIDTIGASHLVKRVMPTLNDLGIALVDWALVGSTFIIGKGEDIDILMQVTGGIEAVNYSDNGLARGGSECLFEHDRWVSLKDANGTNFLLTTSRPYYEAWCTSAEVCRLLHLQGVSIPKDLRVAIHNVVMDDSTAEEEHETITKARSVGSASSGAGLDSILA
jgi:hypothetical protein